MNALRTLEVLRATEACSRADLVRQLGLSAPTVTSVVGELEAAGLVEALGEGVSKGGRPPDMIRFRAERGCLAAVQISATELRLLLTDLNGRALGSSAVSLRRRTSTPEAVCKLFAEAVVALLSQFGQGRRGLLAVVVGVPAITDVENGIVVGVSTLKGWRSVPLRAMLRRELRCVVVIENDTNLAAVGERLRGAARGQDDFALVSIGENVSAGIVLLGRLHHGAQWSAGEIGYLRLPETSRRLPAMHEFGELERVITVSGLVREWERKVAGTRSGKTPGERAKAVLDLAYAGAGGQQARARRLIRARAALVGDVVVDLALILNPSLVVLTGLVGGHPVMLEEVRQQLAGSEFAIPPMVAGELGEEATLWGAIAVAMEHLPGILLPKAKGEANVPRRSGGRVRVDQRISKSKGLGGAPTTVRAK